MEDGWWTSFSIQNIKTTTKWRDFDE